MTNINYILPVNLTLSSSPPFNTNGLNLIYKLSNISLNYLLQDFNVSSLNSTQYLEIANQNKRIVGYVGVLAILTIILLLLGLFWCCRDCCRKSDKRKHDRKCGRNFWTLIYGALVLGFMFLVISTTLTNEQLKSTIKVLPTQFNSTLHDASSYLNLTKTQVHTLFILNYGKLESSLIDTIAQSGEFIKNDLADNLQIEDNFQKITEFLNVVQEVHGILLELFNASKMIKTKARQLEISLVESRERLSKVVAECNCGDQILEEFRKELGEDSGSMVEIDLNQLPHLNSTLRELSDIISLDIQSILESIKAELNTLSLNLQSEINSNLPAIREKLNSTKYELIHYNNLIVRSISNIQEKINSVFFTVRENEVEDKLEQYEFIRYSSTLGTIGALIAILACLVITSCIGFCGKQPGSNIECCSRELGSSFIICSTFLIIATAGFITAMMMGYLVLTGTVWIGCENSTSSTTGFDEYIPKEIDIDGTRLALPKTREIIDSCAKGESAFNTLNLSSVYNVHGIIDLASRFTIPKVKIPNLSFNVPRLKLNVDSVHKINYTKIINSLDQPILTINLDHIINELTLIQGNEEESDSQTRLLNEVVFLNGINSFIYRPLIELVNNSLDGIRRVEKLKNGIRVSEIEKLIQLPGLTGNLKNQITGSITTFQSNFMGQIQLYSNYTLDSILNKVGQCYPLFKIYKNNQDYVCMNLKLPLSGLWFCLNLIFLSYFPILFIGRILKRLYQRGKKYVNRFDGSDTNHLGDSYSSDTIPLNTNNERKHRQPSNGRPASSRASTSRYSKGWNDQRAQPQLHHQPTHPASDEYERPPPYYYPGPAGQ